MASELMRCVKVEVGRPGFPVPLIVHAVVSVAVKQQWTNMQVASSLYHTNKADEGQF